MSAARHPSTRWTYLRDIEPDWLGAQVARHFRDHIRRLSAAALGVDAAEPSETSRAGDDEAARAPVARLARRLCRFALSGTGLDADGAEDLVKRYCGLLAQRVRGSVPQHAPSFRGRDELLLADMRSVGRGKPLPDAFPEMAEVLLAAKARILLARDEAIALRELAALASRPVNAVRRRLWQHAGPADLVDWQKLRDQRRGENRGVRVQPAAARQFLKEHRVPGF